LYRYAVFSWNAADSQQTAAAGRLLQRLQSTATDWETVFGIPGLQVLHAPHPGGACRAYVLDGNGGVVLGKLFERGLDPNDVPFDPVLDRAESARLIESEGRHLIERYWGHYVAVLPAPDMRTRRLLRDPTGGLQCYLTKSAGVDVVLSDVEDCDTLGLTPFSVDWTHLTTFFHDNRLVTRTTGFKEVTQLHAGECVTLRGNGPPSYRFYWHPATVCKTAAIEDPDRAQSELRAVVRHCVGAWAASYDSILHQLSGGLDSSVVAACIAAAGVRPEAVCFHYFTEASEGDERQYARAVAADTGLELVECGIRVAEIPLEDLLSPARCATPAALGLVPEPELLKRRLVRERRAGAVFSGQGGDQLFQEARSKRVAAEYVHRHGLGRRLVQTLVDTSRLTHESFWAVCAAAFRYGLLRRPFDPYAERIDTPMVLSRSARASFDPRSAVHPWLEDARQLPAAKAEHVMEVIDCQPFQRMPCHYAEQVHPLISQPIIEQALKTPTYLLAIGGRPRGLIRKAFDNDVPAIVLERKTKGETTGYFNRVLVENAGFLRELLLDGVLAKEGLLDRRELEKLLSERELILGNGRREIVNSVIAEAWLGNWSDGESRVGR